MHIICLRVLFAILVVLIAAFIFYMSAQEATKSSNTSGRVIVKIISAIDNSYKLKSPAEQRVIVHSLQKIVRKSAHFCVYGLLGVFAASFLATFKMRFIGRFLLSQLFCSLYAVSDEIHQKFVVGRSCEIRDMLIDSGGAFCGIIVILFIVYICEKRKEVKKVMRKKELIKQNEALTEKLLEANSLIKSLEDSIKDKDNEIRILSEKITALEASLLTKKEEPAEDLPCKEEQEAEITETVAVEQITESVPAQDYHDFDFLRQNNDNKSNDINEYAVKIIGKIVTESVKVNCVLASSGSANKKELINLVLGRTEVAKEEISSILATDLNGDLLKTSIDKECDETLDYFQSILGQI